MIKKKKLNKKGCGPKASATENGKIWTRRDAMRIFNFANARWSICGQELFKRMFGLGSCVRALCQDILRREPLGAPAVQILLLAEARRWILGRGSLNVVSPKRDESSALRRSGTAKIQEIPNSWLRVFLSTKACR